MDKTSSNSVNSGASYPLEQQGLPEASVQAKETGNIKNHRVNVKFEEGSKEKASDLFKSTKETISSFFSNVSKHLENSTKPLERGNEGFLSKIAKILSKIFSFFTSKESQVDIKDSPSGKQAIYNSLSGKEISIKEVPIIKGGETLYVNEQFYKDLSRSNISWNGELLLKKEERTKSEFQYDACKKMESNLGVQGFKNISLVMNQGTLADALGNLMAKYSDDQQMVFGLGMFPEHLLEFRLDATDPDEVKLTIKVDFALAQLEKTDNLMQNQNIKDTNPQYIVYSREITIPRSELNIDWSTEVQGREAASGIKVVDHVSKPLYSYEEAKNAVA
ncbi:MAG: hypothetical protein H0V82_08810 [Candidatus Protochlamydia sp.]|nr:hypothetical protein [Candidatus Protochlamydia sp.]